jgi:GAG-pre-integrase domain
MENRSLALRDVKGRLVAKMTISNNKIFLIHLNTFMGIYLLAKDSESWRRHLRFGDLNFDGLQLLGKVGMVHSLPKIEKPYHMCEVCTLSKKHYHFFSKGQSWRAK